MRISDGTLEFYFIKGPAANIKSWRKHNE